MKQLIVITQHARLKFEIMSNGETMLVTFRIMY